MYFRSFCSLFACLVQARRALLPSKPTNNSLPKKKIWKAFPGFKIISLEIFLCTSFQNTFFFFLKIEFSEWPEQMKIGWEVEFSAKLWDGCELKKLKCEPVLLWSEVLSCALHPTHAKYFQNKYHVILGRLSHIITALLGRELVKWKLWGTMLKYKHFLNTAQN